MKHCPACSAEFSETQELCPNDGHELMVREFVKRTGELLTGKIIEGKYKLEQRIGRGGMGSVYLARHTNFNKIFAIKVLSSDIAQDPSAYKRFRQEAEACAKIKHPNAVDVNDFGKTPDPEGLVYMVMEYIEGSTLRKIMERGGALSPERAVHLARQICAGISAAHRAGIVHRDLKPDNVMVEIIDGQEVAKVLDFGIAKLKDTQYQSSITKTNSVLGTPNYMSPEQCTGTTVDARSDIYSLGVMLYEMLSGQLPFRAATAPAIIVQHVTKEPTPLIQICNKVPEPLSHVVMRALAKEPSKRQQSATDLASQMEAAITIASFPQANSNPPANKSITEPKQWRVIYEGLLDSSEAGKKRLLEGLQKGFGLPADKAAELIKGKRYVVKKAPTQLEANIVAERLRAIGAAVKVEAVADKTSDLLGLQNTSEASPSRATENQNRPATAEKTSKTKHQSDSAATITDHPQEDIAIDPLMVSGSEMMDYVTQQTKIQKIKADAAKEAIKVVVQPPLKETAEIDKPTQQIPVSGPQYWQIDIQGMIYDNMSDGDVEAWIRAGRLRHTHRIRHNQAGTWYDVASVPQFRRIIEAINPQVFQPLTAIETEDDRDAAQHPVKRFLSKFTKLSVAVIIVYTILILGIQYSQHRLLEDELRNVLNDGSTTVENVRDKVQDVLKRRAVTIPKENVHITVDLPKELLSIRVNYDRTLLQIPLHYQAKKEKYNFKMSIDSLAKVAEGDLDIVNPAPSEIERYKREQIRKRVAEGTADYQGEAATLKERNDIQLEISEFEQNMRTLNTVSTDDQGHRIFPKSVTIRNREYTREQVESHISELKERLTNVEQQLYDQRLNKKLELEKQANKSLTSEKAPK